MRLFRSVVLEGKVAAPVSLAMRAAFAEARVVADSAANEKLAKAGEGQRRRRRRPPGPRSLPSYFPTGGGLNHPPDLPITPPTPGEIPHFGKFGGAFCGPAQQNAQVQ